MSYFDHSERENRDEHNSISLSTLIKMLGTEYFRVDNSSYSLNTGIIQPEPLVPLQNTPVPLTDTSHFFFQIHCQHGKLRIFFFASIFSFYVIFTFVIDF